MYIEEKFQLPTLNNLIWEKDTKDSGTNIYIKDDSVYIQQSNGWSGGYIRTKKSIPIIKLKNKFIAEFDIEISGNYHNGGAGVRPYVGFVGANCTRETTYYYSSTNQNLVLEFDSNLIALGTRNSDQNNINFRSINYSAVQKIRMKITIDRGILRLFINENTSPYIEYNVPDNIWNDLGDAIRFEFFLGNYCSGQYMKISNIVIKDTFNKILIQDGENIKTTDGVLLSLISETPYKIEYFKAYDIESFEKINKDVINNIQDNKFKISILRKQ